MAYRYGFNAYDSEIIATGIHWLTGGTGGREGAANRMVALVSGVPIVGDIVRGVEQDKYYSDYLRNRGLTWADVKYPTRLSYGSGVGSTLSFVSKNITNLYGSDEEVDKAQTKLEDFF